LASAGTRGGRKGCTAIFVLKGTVAHFEPLVVFNYHLFAGSRKKKKKSSSEEKGFSSSLVPGARFPARKRKEVPDVAEKRGRVVGGGSPVSSGSAGPAFREGEKKGKEERSVPLRKKERGEGRVV